MEREWRMGTLFLAAFTILLAGTWHVCLGQDRGEGDDEDGQPAFCGPPDERLEVIRQPQGTEPGPLSAGRARVNLFWRGSRLRSWAGTRCKVALNGSWVAALRKNTYSAVDVEPGKLRFCGASNHLKPTWRSLLFLHATEGGTYYVECSPGGDTLGTTEPTLSELDETAGYKVISKQRLVTFRPREEQ